MSAALIVAGARACLGTRFRPQGREPGLALDCAGLVLAALAKAGRAIDAPRDYSLRGDGLAARAEEGLAAGGVFVTGAIRPGDLIVFEPVAGVAHLAVASEAGVIQVHLGIGRVVEGPADPAWPIRSVWRFVQGE